MSTEVQYRYGTTAEHSSFTGVQAEMTIDTTKNTVVVHNGATVGGFPLAREDQIDLVNDTSPQLGADLDVNNFKIVNGTANLDINADGTTVLQAADGGTNGYQILIEGGVGSGGTGGNITIRGGDGSTAGGSIFLDVGLDTTNNTDPGQIILQQTSGVAAPQMKFSEAASNGTNSIIIQAPDDITTSRTWTLPQNDPADVNGGNLTTDASGNLYFQPNNPHKNALINGNFDIWQRGTSNTHTSASSAGQFTADRWITSGFLTSGTVDVTQESFTTGQTDVPNNPTYYIRISGTSAITPTTGYVDFNQRIENVSTFAGETITLSFWGKASTSRKIGYYMFRVHGTGGSANHVLTGSFAQLDLTTSWQKFNVTIDVPSIAGKTIGAGNYVTMGFRLVSKGNDGVNNFDSWSDIGDLGSDSIDLAQFQLEKGSVTTPFEKRHIAEELVMCQRYYEKSYSLDQPPGTTTENGSILCMGHAVYTTNIEGFEFKVTKRATPTITFYSTATGTAGTARDATSASDVSASPGYVGVNGVPVIVSSGIVADHQYYKHFTADAEL